MNLIRNLIVAGLSLGILGFPSIGWSQENVLVVVNEDSPESLTLANHYIAVRKIPSTNVVYLSNLPEIKGGETFGSSAYQKSILNPIMDEIKNRGLEPQLRYVAFSAGFATRINCRDSQQKYLESTGKKYSIHFHTPFISMNSAMFFNDALYQEQPWFLDPNANWFADPMATTSRSFSSQMTWPDPASSSDRPPARFYLASMLAVIGPDEASTLPQAIEQVKRAAAADGTQPQGIFYFAKNGDPRSKTRHNQINAAVAELEQLGFETKVSDQRMPPAKSKVLGAVLGSAKLNWADSKAEFVPGAICDTFTSYGAFFQKSQTKLTHFLNHGASGSVGMVAEPYTIPYKIPTTMAHVHYARGCTLAESLYQTIGNPYMMLMVGDPICRPFAKFAQFEVDGISDRSLVKQDLTITCEPTGDSQIDSVSVYVDGVRDSQGNLPGEQVNLSIDELGYGYHEIRVVAIGPDPVRVRTSQVFEVFVQPQVSEKWGDLRLTVEDNEQDESESFSVAYKLPEGASGEIRQNQRVIARLSARRTSVDIPANKLGGGPSRIRLVVEDEGQIVSGVPVPVVVTGGTDE